MINHEIQLQSQLSLTRTQGKLRSKVRGLAKSWTSAGTILQVGSVPTGNTWTGTGHLQMDDLPVLCLLYEQSIVFFFLDFFQHITPHQENVVVSAPRLPHLVYSYTKLRFVVSHGPWGSKRMNLRVLLEVICPLSTVEHVERSIDATAGYINHHILGSVMYLGTRPAESVFVMNHLFWFASLY